MARRCNDIEKRPEWLSASRHAIDFILAHGFDTDGRVFFSVTREGKPLRKRRYLFAEIFAIMAFAEYGKAAVDATILEKAKQLMRFVQEMYAKPWDAPGALEPKVFLQTRPMRGHSMAMIQINTLQILRQADSSGSPLPYERMIDAQIDEAFRYFVKPEMKALLETVGPNGEYLGDTPEGRCVNPGHAIETAWFIMAEAKRRGDKALLGHALEILDWSLRLCWDEKYGGILYFVDIEGKQPVQYEWDMKPAVLNVPFAMGRAGGGCQGVRLAKCTPYNKLDIRMNFRYPQLEFDHGGGEGYFLRALRFSGSGN